MCYAERNRTVCKTFHDLSVGISVRKHEVDFGLTFLCSAESIGLKSLLEVFEAVGSVVESFYNFGKAGSIEACKMILEFTKSRTGVFEDLFVCNLLISYGVFDKIVNAVLAVFV